MGNGFPAARGKNLWSFIHGLYDQGALGFLGFGNIFYCDPKNGSDQADGTSLSTAKKTLLAAYNLCVDAHNDVVVLVGDGTTAATARVDASFTWSKNATHLLGICSPTVFSQRARIAPTGTTTAFTPFFTISGNGCIFQNIQWFHGFNTGTTSQINLVVTGDRNTFNNCHIAGMGDATSAGSTGSRSLKIGGSGSGENVFQDCGFGLDTVDRTNASATIEFVGGATRNVFRDCKFLSRATNAAVLSIIGSAAGCIDRYNIFERCMFLNHNTTRTALATLPASAGGFLLFKDCVVANVTGYGSDATTRTQTYVMGSSGTAATTGLAVNPSA